MIVVLMVFVLLIYGSAMLPWPRRVIRSEKVDKLSEQTMVSVVVPFRNESIHLNKLLQSISKIDYPKDKLEIILVNDHSLDQGALIVGKWKENCPFKFHLLELEKEKGKKAALSMGVKHAIGELVLFTDADCRVQPGWVASFDKLYRVTKSVMITGTVFLEGSSSFLSSFQKLDQAILMKLTENYINANRAILANAANMAIKREVFEEQFLLSSKSMSGDDIFLLHALKSKFNGRIQFISDPEAAVFTQVKMGFFSFLAQRLRWASKAKYYRDIDSLIVGGIVFITNAGLILLLMACIFDLSFLNLLLIFFLSKSFIDLLVLSHSNNYLEDRKSLRWIPFYALVYPFYSIGIALLSLLYNPKWKGRTV